MEILPPHGFSSNRGILRAIEKQAEGLETLQTLTGAATMHEIDYTNKPSITTLKAAIKKAAAAGKTFIVLSWGENQITIEQVQYAGGYRPQWVGRGWIGRNGGQDIANALNLNK